MDERRNGPARDLPLGRIAVTDDRPAVVEPGRGAVTYDALDKLADRAAGRLRALGVEPGDRVGVYLRRSADAIAAVLGAIRAGCTYVPMDPAAPVQRNAEIHADCGVAVSLVEQRFEPAFREAARRVAPRTNIQTLGDVGLGRAVAEWAPGDARASSGPEPDVACILYTSGSTGRHKGWLMSRRAIEAHADWARGLLRPTAADAFANHAQLNFGMSLFDVFASLRSGARLVLVPDEARTVAARVVEILGRERVTIWFSGPMILSLIAELENLESHDLAALRVVAFAGEVFPAPALSTLRRRIPHPRYFNFYGSTETNVAAFYELPAGTEFETPPPIGRPCAHYEARVAAESGAAAPAGEIGELQFRGAGLDSGYLNQPELNTDRFVPDPGGGSSWYRTCDLAVEQPDGNLRYAGRIGRMVKLRGYRVEPGEIEIRLHEHPRIAEAAVVPEDGPNGLRLVAHLGGPRLPVVELKQFCAVKLPAYMIPERFEFHEALPRNLRGKIDLEALRAHPAGDTGR